jgi:hypothetical protein
MTKNTHSKLNFQPKVGNRENYKLGIGRGQLLVIYLNDRAILGGVCTREKASSTVRSSSFEIFTTTSSLS